MRLNFELPEGFVACGVTMVFQDETGMNIYSTSITPDEVAAEKVITLPRGNNDDVE